MCILDQFAFLVCLRAPPFREILSSLLAVLFALSFALALAFAPTRLAFAFASVLFAFVLAGLAFGFVVPDHPLVRMFCMYAVFFRQSLAMWP